MLKIVLPSVINTVDTERIAKTISNRFAVLEDRDIMIEKASRHAFITYVLNHLQYFVLMENSEDSNLKTGSMISFLLLPSESEESQNPLLSEIPTSLVPILVNFRRRSSSDEIESAINAVGASRKSLKLTIEKAENHQKRVSQVIDIAASALGGDTNYSYLIIIIIIILTLYRCCRNST